MGVWLVTVEKQVRVEDVDTEEEAVEAASYQENDGELSVLYAQPIED